MVNNISENAEVKYAIVSDIHSNLEALEAVLSDVETNYPGSKLVVPGDVLGYMANPNEVMDIIWQKAFKILKGNHDISCRGVIKAEYSTLRGMNPEAREAIIWNAEQLNDKNKERIRLLVDEPGNLMFEENGIMFAHSTPFEPDEMFYVVAKRGFDGRFVGAENIFFRNPKSIGKIAFVGHSHVPQIYLHAKNDTSGKILGNQVEFFQCTKFYEAGKALRQGLEGELTLCPDINEKRKVRTWSLNDYESALICVPSVGQPRDGLNLAGYAVYNPKTKKLEMVRVQYDIAKTQKKMIDVGLPERLAERLALGR